MTNIDLDPAQWILCAPNGKLAIYRFPLAQVPEGARLATSHELLCANRGHPFPWGSLPEPHPDNAQWRTYSVGIGGLVHKQWFVTSDGRYGGASNVTQTLPGSLRCCMYLSGGGKPSDSLADNEGYAVVKETSAEDIELYRRLQHYACRYIAADGGALVASPIQAGNQVYVGFVGRCQICPNLELISYPQLQSAIPEFNFQLWPEWKGWSLRKHTPESTPIIR